MWPHRVPFAVTVKLLKEKAGFLGDAVKKRSAPVRLTDKVEQACLMP